MANNGNDLSPSLYKKLLVENYVQNRKDGTDIKNNFVKNRNPILQKGDKYAQKHIRANALTKDYHKKMNNKPEKKQKKKIDMPNCIAKNLKIVENSKKIGGIKMNEKMRTNQDSTITFDIPPHRKMFYYPDTMKNFNFENYSTVVTQEPKVEYGRTVSKLILFFINIAKIYE